MYKLRKSIISSATLLVWIMTGTANTAALEVREAEEVHDWTGFYIGGHLGFGKTRWQGIYDNFDSTGGSPLRPLADGGGIFGGQIGYNLQIDAVLLGVELEAARANLKDSATGTDFLGRRQAATTRAETEFLGSLRGRLGWTWDRLLIYATGGVAIHDTELTISDPNVTPPTDQEKFDNVAGTVGGGVEVAIRDNVSLRAQYLYYFFNKTQGLFPGAGDADRGDFAKFKNIHSMTFGANFHF